jgi:hypothetical protein
VREERDDAGDREAKGVYRRFTGNTDDFPRWGTRWFRDWFYPLWRDCGRAKVMNRFCAAPSAKAHYRQTIPSVVVLQYPPLAVVHLVAG